jgi:hypothetical protein
LSRKFLILQFSSLFGRGGSRYFFSWLSERGPDFSGDPEKEGEQDSQPYRPHDRVDQRGFKPPEEEPDQHRRGSRILDGEDGDQDNDEKSDPRKDLHHPDSFLAGKPFRRAAVDGGIC